MNPTWRPNTAILCARIADELPKVSWKSVPSSSLSTGMTSGNPYMMRSRLISPAIEMSKVFIEASAVGMASQSGVRFENIPCHGRDGKNYPSRFRTLNQHSV